jgi:hypothetical protein
MDAGRRLMLTHAHLIASLERRFDYYSARVIAREVLSAVGLREKDTYSDAEHKLVIEALGRRGDRVTEVVGFLGTPGGSTAAAAPVAPPAAPPEVEAAAAPLVDSADDSASATEAAEAPIEAVEPGVAEGAAAETGSTEAQEVTDSAEDPEPEDAGHGGQKKKRKK